MVYTCRQTYLPASRIDKALEDPHYEVANDNWRVKGRRMRLPRLRVIQQQIKDARSMN